MQGRAVEPGEPLWLPEDRDVVEVWQYFEATRHDVCGKWLWEEDDLAEYGLDYDVCPFCAEIEKKATGVRERRDSMAGVMWVYTPPELEGISDGH